MKVNPASWMQMVTKHRATVAVCKSRDLHWGLLGMVLHIEKKKGLEVEIEIFLRVIFLYFSLFQPNREVV